MREGKKAWFEARREKGRQRHGWPNASDSDGALSAENDRETALAVVKRIVNSPLRGNNDTSDCSRGDGVSGRERGFSRTHSSPAPDPSRAGSPCLPSPISASGQAISLGSSIEGCSSRHGGVMRLRASIAGQPIAVGGRVTAGRDPQLLNGGGSREDEETKQEEEGDL